MGTVTKVELIRRLNHLRDEIERLRKDLETNKFNGDEEETRLFWDSFGSWQDDRTSEEIITDIYQSRRSTSRDATL
jgi:hypothetical protein